MATRSAPGTSWPTRATSPSPRRVRGSARPARASAVPLRATEWRCSPLASARSALAKFGCSVSPWLLTPGGRLDHLPPDPGRDRVLRDVPVPDAAPAVVDHDEHVARAEGEGLHREQVSSPDAGRVVAQKRAPRLTRRSPERLLTVAAHGASAHVAAKRTQLTNDADGAPPWMLSGDAQDQPLPRGGNVGTPRSATTLPAPVGAPSRTMPPNNRVRLDHHERAAPAGPTACQ